VVVALFMLGSLAAQARAQVPAGGEFRVNTYTTDHQAYAWMASDAVGNFVVAWTSYGQDGSDGGIFGQRYYASGQPRGGEFQVNTYTAGDQRDPAVASDAGGHFVVAWQSHEDGSAYSIVAQRYDAAGLPRGSEFQVNTYTTSYQWFPSVASDAVGNFVVAWTSYGQDGDRLGVFAQRYDAAGLPRASEFRVNIYTTSSQWLPSVASDAVGNFVVAWHSWTQDGDSDGVFAQRYDAAGQPQGGEFQVNTYTPGRQADAALSFDAVGNFVVAWTGEDGSDNGIFARRYDAAGQPRGGEFQVNTHTSNWQYHPAVAADAAGNFVVAWTSYRQDGGYTGSYGGVFAQRYDSSGVRRGGEFQVNTYTTDGQKWPTVASDSVGNFVVAWHSRQDGSGNGVFAQRHGGIEPTALAVDPTGNGVLEAGETVDVKPSWKNANGATQTFDGVGAGFSGPPAAGVNYSITDAAAVYGTVDNGTTAQCSDCYQLGVGFTGTRPATHWDATFTERLTPDTLGQTKQWQLHVGESFTDMPKTSGYYRFVETLLHKGVTGGCTATTYCPGSSATRGQMAVFALVGKEGSSYSPPACGTTPMFPDVPVTSPYCKWVEELARRGVVGGCGGGNYCPSTVVTRGQMPIFMLKTLDPAFDPPACTTPMFADVLATSPYCKWIEELARRGVVSGCGGGNYCPSNPVTRGQMAVFISSTFGLTLYGP
jgi:hypothetical protein